MNNSAIVTKKTNGKKFYYDTRDHIWIYVQLPFFDNDGNELCFSDENDNSKNFIFDTGAQNTIVSKARAKECGYLNLPVYNKVNAGGIGGGVIHCRRIAIPNITITTGLVVQNPTILVSEDDKVNLNVLGMDILKPFSLYLDAQEKYIFFDLDNSIDCK